MKTVTMKVILFTSLMICSSLGLADQTLTLSLPEAIFLAIRQNPNVEQAQLNHIQQKFALNVAQWQFQPHFALIGTVGISKSVTNCNQTTSKNGSIQPSASWLSPIGTQFTLTSTNNVTNHYNPGVSLQVVQPLLRGFGRPIVEASLYNAMDSELISRLTIQNVLRITVTNVINAYLNVVSAANIIKIDHDALNRAKLSVLQTKLFIKAGRKAGVEIVTVEADVANAETKLENDKNNFDQSRYSLLAAIGIDPNTKVTITNIDIPELINRYCKPSLDETKRLTLENDIQYQIDQIILQGTTRRNLLLAEDNTRWQLNLTANAGVGSAAGGGINAGFPSLINGANQAQNVQLNLIVPIDDRNAKQALLAAKIGLREAKIALQQEKWTKETNAINGWNTLNSAKRALYFADNAEILQLHTYEISFQKYKYGLIDSVELQSVQQQLIARQQSLLDAKLNYLKALVSLDQQIGKTLQTWGIQLRYACASI